MFKVRGSGPEELPHGRGQGRQPKGATLVWMPGAAARESYPAPKARGSSGEEQPHIQGAVAAWVQEGLEEPSHVEGQEGRR